MFAAGPGWSRVAAIWFSLAGTRFPLHHSIRRRGKQPMSDDTAPRGALTVRTIAMPADTNANGDIFGGWVMSHMDQAGGIAGWNARAAAW